MFDGMRLHLIYRLIYSGMVPVFPGCQFYAEDSFRDFQHPAAVI